MRDIWKPQSLFRLLLVTVVVTCTPLKSHDALQTSQQDEGVVTGIPWQEDQGLQRTLLSKSDQD
jgi:hypothetical protein